MVIIPKPLPAHSWLTRIQTELSSSVVPSRSQGNWTRTRPSSSVWISWPSGPTTRALCTPRTRGFAIVAGGRNGVEVSTAFADWFHTSPGAPSKEKAVTRRVWPPAISGCG